MVTVDLALAVLIRVKLRRRLGCKLAQMQLAVISETYSTVTRGFQVGSKSSFAIHLARDSLVQKQFQCCQENTKPPNQVDPYIIHQDDCYTKVGWISNCWRCYLRKETLCCLKRHRERFGGL